MRTGISETCPLLNIAYLSKWKQDPVRDFTDLMILIALYGFYLHNDTINIASVIEVTGISKATATRRVRHFSTSKVVEATRMGNSLFLKLTDEGIVLAVSITERLGCAHNCSARPCHK
ncbi:hypothetical protein MCP1_130035 [Candidatus Terasakiella magnetica]|nr:hypothetical protein MCP1_130035 [Candidatus Terasakiella magnetica]